jgi:hypothetical protein
LFLRDSLSRKIIVEQIDIHNFKILNIKFTTWMNYNVADFRSEKIWNNKINWFLSDSYLIEQNTIEWKLKQKTIQKTFKQKLNLFRTISFPKLLPKLMRDVDWNFPSETSELLLTIKLIKQFEITGLEKGKKIKLLWHWIKYKFLVATKIGIKQN